jgi:uncharacterized protein (TIGR03435 family)
MRSDTCLRLCLLCDLTCSFLRCRYWGRSTQQEVGASLARSLPVTALAAKSPMKSKIGTAVGRLSVFNITVSDARRFRQRRFISFMANGLTITAKVGSLSLGFLAVVSIAHSQAAAGPSGGGSGSSNRPISFEVASIRPSRGVEWSTRFTEDGFDADSAPLQYLLRVAFSPRIAPPDILGEPKWAADGYDIHAKVAPEDLQAYKALSREQRGQILQVLLADRFHLRFHYGTIEHSVYDLKLLGAGSKLKSLKVGEDYAGNGYSEPLMPVDEMLRFQAHPSSMAQLARRLSWIGDVEGKEVIDRTGLAGFYNFDLTWCPIQAASEATPTTCNGESLFSALREQLELELKPATASFPTLIIDHIERPSPN